MSKLQRLILASRSPRRQQLLAEAGYQFDVLPPAEAAECGICSGESPPEYVARLALQKAADVTRQIDRGLVLACDTVAEWGGQVLGKPQNEAHARQMLEMLSGREHHVYSGLCLWDYPVRDPFIEVASTTLRMERLTKRQIDEYLASGLWEGKAGAFGYQDRLGWLHVLEGSETNVVGLPMELLGEMLQKVAAR
jgi:septum formation protein